MTIWKTTLCKNCKFWLIWNCCITECSVYIERLETVAGSTQSQESSEAHRSSMYVQTQLPSECPKRESRLDCDSDFRLLFVKILPLTNVSYLMFRVSAHREGNIIIRSADKYKEPWSLSVVPWRGRITWNALHLWWQSGSIVQCVTDSATPCYTFRYHIVFGLCITVDQEMYGTPGGRDITTPSGTKINVIGGMGQGT